MATACLDMREDLLYTSTDSLVGTVITLGQETVSIPVGGTASNTVKVSSGATPGFSSDNPSVATVNSSSGTVTGVAEGTAVITVSVASVGNYSAASASYTVIVTAGESGTVTTVITFEHESLTLKVGAGSKNAATASSGAAISYISSDPSIASVASDGTVTGIAAGTTSIVASCDATEGYTAASASFKVKVTGDSSADDDSDIDPMNSDDDVTGTTPDYTVNIVYSGSSATLSGLTPW